MKVYDLKELGTNEISFYLALEKYLVKEKKLDDCFFLWEIDKSIIIGKNQVLKNEVNIYFTREIGAKIYRRPSGGGGIYADSGCFMYSFIVQAETKDDAYNKTLPKLVKILNDLGVDASFSGRNDLLFRDKKFSGCAIYYIDSVIILHGTFMYDTNIENLVRALTPNKEKLISKGIESVKSRVINLKPYLKIDKNELMDYIIHNISDENTLLKLEKEEIDDVLEIKKGFDDYNYIYLNDPKYTYFKKKRFNFGEIELRIDVARGKIKDINFMGDFFLCGELGEYLDKFKGALFDIDKIKDIINQNDVSKYIVDCKNSDIIDLLGE